MAFFQKNISIAQQVSRIKKQLNSVAQKCEAPVGQTLFTQAALVAAEISSLAPVDSTSDTPGALRASVRVEEGTPTEKKKFVLKIKAGGQTTQKYSSSGKAFDYARAVEFGTQDMAAKPFFFPVWRARRKSVRAAVRKAIGNSVKDVFK